MNKDNKTNFIATSAIIAALYAVLSLALAPISYGLLQVRIAEALCVLPYFTAAAVPGLFIGCLLANAIGVALGLTVGTDVLFGSIATLLAAVLGRLLRKRAWLVPLPAVLVNAVIIGCELYFVFGVNVSLLACMLYVGVGQILSCYVLGLPLLGLLKKYGSTLFTR